MINKFRVACWIVSSAELSGLGGSAVRVDTSRNVASDVRQGDLEAVNSTPPPRHHIQDGELDHHARQWHDDHNVCSSRPRLLSEALV